MTTTPARCLDPKCEDGPVDADGRPAPRLARDGNLCRRCGLLLEQRLAEIPARRDALCAVLHAPLPRAGTSGGKRTKAEAPPIEFGVELFDHLTLMHATLVSWVLMVTEERGLRGPDRDDDRILSGWLLSQLPWLLEHGAVGDLADEMRDLSRVADSLARLNLKRYRLEPPCPMCGAFELGREDGADQVTCEACGGVWREDAYPWMVRLALDDSGGCVTAQEAADRAQVPAATFRQWVSRGRVRRLGTVDGLARYSTADLDRVLSEGEVA